MSAIKHCIILFVIFTVSVTSGKSLGEVCTIESTGKVGVCKLFDDCKKVYKDLPNNPNSKGCGFKENEKMICCPMAKETILQRIKKETNSKKEPGAISKAKCREYSKYVTEIQKQPILLIDAPDVEKNECGHQVVKLIVGGENAQKKEFPHMAVIGFETPKKIEWICGGTIISNRYILTAAHCLDSRNHGFPKYIQVGMSNLKEKDDRRQQLQISERIPHPLYNKSFHYNDIGLLKLETPIKLNSYARPACLYNDKDVTTKLAIATGWGHTSYEGNINEDLLKVTLDLVNYDTCKNTKGFQKEKKLKQGILDESQICAGSLNASVIKDTCQGDSGGPLQIYHIGDDIQCMYDIIGITSFGKACGDSPGVYTRVSHYIEWIEDIVWA